MHENFSEQGEAERTQGPWRSPQLLWTGLYNGSLTPSQFIPVPAAETHQSNLKQSSAFVAYDKFKTGMWPWSSVHAPPKKKTFLKWRINFEVIQRYYDLEQAKWANTFNSALHRCCD